MVSAVTRTTTTRQHDNTSRFLSIIRKYDTIEELDPTKKALTTQIDALRERLEALDKFRVYKKTYYRILDQIALQRSK